MSRFGETVQPAECTQTDGCYQVHYLPASWSITKQFFCFLCNHQFLVCRLGLEGPISDVEQEKFATGNFRDFEKQTIRVQEILRIFEKLS